MLSECPFFRRRGYLSYSPVTESVTAWPIFISNLPDLVVRIATEPPLSTLSFPCLLLPFSVPFLPIQYRGFCLQGVRQLHIHTRHCRRRLLIVNLEQLVPSHNVGRFCSRRSRYYGSDRNNLVCDVPTNS